MDDLVLAAMARWADVPEVYGWLRLDRRGRWMLVDRGAPGFDERLHGAGSEITNPGIVAFIGRNYAGDARGRWYWQNGPQRAYVDLELAPHVARVVGSGRDARLVTHTGLPVERIDAVAASAAGDLFVVTEHGPAAIHDLDLASLEIRFASGAGEHAAAIEWVAIGAREHPVRIVADPAELGFVAVPRPDRR